MKKSVKASIVLGSVFAIPAVAPQLVGSSADASEMWVSGNSQFVLPTAKQETKPAVKPVVKKQGWEKTTAGWKYYYNGEEVKNKWIADYYVGANGVMVTNTWVGNYYVGANGKYDPTKKKELPKPKEETKKEVKPETPKKEENKKEASKEVTRKEENKKETPKEEKKVGWQKTSTGLWYHYDAQGNMSKNKWIGNYWLGSDGVMATNAWVDNGKYYVDATGKWVADKKKEEKKVGWQKTNTGLWYHYDAQGNMSKNKWIGNYWLGSDGVMATNVWVDNGKYYVDATGKWVANATKNTTTSTSSSKPSLEKVLELSRSYLGATMYSQKHLDLVKTYNSVKPLPVGYAVKNYDDWCDIFVTTMFMKAGLSDLIGRECGVERHINIFKNKGIWLGKSLPKVGDIVTYDWDGNNFADHIGIVESVKDGKITTIEGNTRISGSKLTGVGRQTIDWNNWQIRGYARPVY